MRVAICHDGYVTDSFSIFEKKKISFRIDQQYVASLNMSWPQANVESIWGGGVAGGQSGQT